MKNMFQYIFKFFKHTKLGLVAGLVLIAMGVLLMAFGKHTQAPALETSYHKPSSQKVAAGSKPNGTVAGDSTQAASQGAATATVAASTATATTGSNAQTNKTTSGGGQNSTPAPAPIPSPAPDPCATITPDTHTMFPETKVEGVTSITIPVGCTSGTYVVKTTDARNVTWWTAWGAFQYLDGSTSPSADAPYFVHVNFNGGGYAASSVSFTVSVKSDAAPNQYENAFYIDDPGAAISGFSFAVKINIVAR